MYTVNLNNLTSISNSENIEILNALESGNVIYFPHLSFQTLPGEEILFSENLLAPKQKNVSYNILTHKINGLMEINSVDLTTSFMNRYAIFAKTLITSILPNYKDTVIWGRTSYRPAEIKGRTTSKRKDDTRLHVDAFASTPVNGLRILRVFCNINPYGIPRVWHLGEPFTEVLKQFSRTIPTYNYFKARLLKALKITKSLRTPYDHQMLHLHDNMKLNDTYQNRVKKTRVDFPAQSTWIVFTDQTSHAALSGQFLLEQTFYLPVEAMLKPDQSPLKQWESIL